MGSGHATLLPHALDSGDKIRWEKHSSPSIIQSSVYISALGATMICVNINFPTRIMRRFADRGACWVVLLLFGVVGLGGCTGGNLHPEITVMQEDQGYAPAAIDHAVDSFLGDWRARAGSGAGGGFGGGGSTPAYRTQRSLETAFGIRARQQLDPRWQLEGVIRGGRGQGRHFLPHGAGIFKDPITIAADTRFAEAEAAITHRLGPGFLPEAVPGSVSVSAGLGVRQVHSRMRINSALLAIDASLRQRLEFAKLSAQYHLPLVRGAGELALFAEARGHGRDSGTLRGGARLILSLSRPR